MGGLYSNLGNVMILLILIFFKSLIFFRTGNAIIVFFLSLYFDGFEAEKLRQFLISLLASAFLLALVSYYEWTR